MPASGLVRPWCSSTARWSYEGPMLARRINKGLLALLERDGFGHISEAVGTDVCMIIHCAAIGIL